MPLIPRFLSSSKRTGRDMAPARKSQPNRRLERCNAVKNFDYDPSPSPSPSSSSFESSVFTRSRDFDELTSIRVEGIVGEMDWICRGLGLSSPDDFAIPEAEWAAMKMRSASAASSQIVEAEREINSEIEVGELGDRFRDSVRVREGTNLISTESNGGGGIRGIRPPSLKPPPVVERLGSASASNDSRDKRRFSSSPSSPDGDVEERVGCVAAAAVGEEEQEEAELRIGEADLLSDSCSFTTSNDGDCSSTTTISPNGRFRPDITSWTKGELLGRGSFGSVYEGLSSHGLFFAAKEVSLLDQGDQGRERIFQLEQEIYFLSHFEHENIVQYYGTEKCESKLYIFLELVTQGTLQQLYKKYSFCDSLVSAYTRQILQGLKYLHDQDVLHRDIKCANILVAANCSVKLADFGLAKSTKLNDVKSCKGTAFWMAPEVVRGNVQNYGLPADIWSLGCTVLEMLTRQFPYAHLNFAQAIYQIGKGVPPTIPNTLSRLSQDFISQCLQVNPEDRPTAAQLLSHPFVRGSHSTS